ncbi:hypothetical protein D3C81_1915020 [compost metagenome]
MEGGECSAEMSSTASSWPCGLKIGTAVQVRLMWWALKWSRWWQVSACCSLMQVPTAQVPAWSSLQSAPRYRPVLRWALSSSGWPRNCTVMPRLSVSSTT